MPRMIFVNLPVADLAKSKAFYEAIGAVNQPKFTDETAACMHVLRHNIHHAAGPRKVQPVHVQADRGCAFDERNAARHFAGEPRGGGCNHRQGGCGWGAPEKAQDAAFMYSRCFEDLDGHIWEPLWMHPEAAVQVPQGVRLAIGFVHSDANVIAPGEAIQMRMAP